MPETLERLRRVTTAPRDAAMALLPTVFCPPDRIHACLDARAQEDGKCLRA